MKALCWIVGGLLLATGTSLAQRHKPTIDPETKEGYLIQLIQQERDPAEKLKQLEQFAAEFPKSASLSWVLDQLQPGYLKAQQYDKVIAAGERMVALDPTDLEAAHSMLLAAEGLQNPELIQKYAILGWKIASQIIAAPGSAKLDYPREVAAYCEYSLAALGDAATDREKKEAYLAELAKLNPKSQWLNATKNDFAGLVAQGASNDKLAVVAESSLPNDPNNEEMLILVADYHMRRGDAPDKVLQYSQRVVDVLNTKSQPPGTDAAQWAEKKERYLGAAYYMIGVISSIRGSYSQADRNLRAALPTIKGANSQVMGAILYHLGYANYRLAEQGERARIFDAIRFNQQCAGIPSSYQDQARKNVDSIRTEYNLK